MSRARIRTLPSLHALAAGTLALTCAVAPSSAAGRTDRSTPRPRAKAAQAVAPAAPNATPPPAAPHDVGSAMVWVIDEAGQPQALASVLLESVDRTWKRTDVADHHGRATFMRIPTGRYHASADVAGFTSDAILLDVTKAPATTHSIVVHPQHAPPTTPAGLGPATLWVIDEAGHPQAFADVTLESVDRTSERSALADEHGSVMFSDVPTGRYHASARLAGFTSDVILVDATKAPATTHSIVVHPEHAAAATTPREAGSATLWVIDETGKPRPSVEVILAPVGDGVKVSMTTDAAGRVVLTGLPPGRYHATASLRRFTSDTVVVDASDAPVRAYSIVVHPSHRHGSRETR